MLNSGPVTPMMPDFATAEDFTINTLEILLKLWSNLTKVHMFVFS